MPNWGAGASGAARGVAMGAGVGSVVPVLGTGIGAVAGGTYGFLKGLFSGGDKDKDKHAAQQAMLASPEAQGLRNSAATNRDRATDFHDQSSELLTPLVSYYQNLLGQNPAAAMQAIQPERGRVIDQYDTARRGIAEFGPRGGGTTSTLAASRMAEAQDLNDLFATSKREAAEQSGTLGTALATMGLNADQLASADLSTIIQMALAEKGIDVQADVARRGQNTAALSGLGQAAGTLLGYYLTRGSGAAA